MTTQQGDYYATLGLDRNASPEDVKRAFRRLAMQYHPDRNKEPEAEQKFKEINQAYEILSDPDKRAAYDRFGHAGVSGGMGGAGFEGTNFGGFGAEAGSKPERCPSCNGAGEIHRVQQSIFGQFRNISTCDRCRGEG